MQMMGTRFTAIYLLLGFLILILLYVQYNGGERERNEHSHRHDDHGADFVGFDFRKYEKSDSPRKWNQLLPKAKRCAKNLNEYLEDIRGAQRQLVEYWWQTRMRDEMKWVALTYVYPPQLINYAALFRFKSDGETKYFLDFIKPPTTCNIWTLGVGLDYRGEASLHSKYPTCQMTAVDPLSDVNKQLVEAIPNARFIEATVGAEDGNYTARLSDAKHVYSTTTMHHSAITPFLQKHNGDRTIDLLLMDIEGAEFGVLSKLIDDMKNLPTICQINVELHYPPENYGYTSEEAFANIHRFLADETYAVFNVEIIRRFIRLYAVNTRSEECVQKFFC